MIAIGFQFLFLIQAGLIYLFFWYSKLSIDNYSLAKYELVNFQKELIRSFIVLLPKWNMLLC